jgi:hypothetical protein
VIKLRTPGRGLHASLRGKAAARVMQWAVGSEPGHSFVLVDESGEVAWLQDYGALENGGVMYVLPHEIVRQVSDHL